MKQKHRLTWLLFTVMITLVVTACSTSEEKTEVTKPVIKLAQRDWLGSQLNNAVASILLKEEMGYPVEIIEVEGATQFESLAQGETHVNLEVWTTAWITDTQTYMEEKKTVEHGGNLGVVGKSGWYIPTYLVKQHPELTTWEGFKDPAKAALFRTSATGESGRFLSNSPEWGGQYDADIIRNLGLNFQVEFAGSEETLIALVEEAYSKQKPILFYFWTPYYLFAKLDLTEVRLPEYSEECYARGDTGGIDCDYPRDILFKAIWPGLKDYAPEAYRFFKNLKLTTDDQIAMLAQIELQGKTVEEAARFWIEIHEDVWSRWVPKNVSK